MGVALNNVTAPDEYDPNVGLLVCPGSVLVRVWVNNQAIYWRRGKQAPGGGGVQWYPEEEFLVPGFKEFPDPVDVVQVRAAVPAAELGEGRRPAQVTIATRTAEEMGQ